MSVVFGRRTRGDDKYVQMMFETAEEFLTHFTPGTYLCDSFPILGKLPRPLQWWKPYGTALYNKTVGYKQLSFLVNGSAYRGFYRDFAKSMEAGTANECFATKFFAMADQYGFDQDQQMFIAGSLIEAGSDTTRNQNNLVIAAAAVYPEWVAKARKQLDEVCGVNAERLPNWEDWEKLTYIHAVSKEGLRWRSNGADTGVPRALT
jgi:Cytochrome P450